MNGAPVAKITRARVAQLVYLRPRFMLSERSGKRASMGSCKHGMAASRRAQGVGSRVAVSAPMN